MITKSLDIVGGLRKYCNWGLTQVKSDRWRNALQIANQVAMDQFLELNTILQHPKVVAEVMVKNKVQPGIAREQHQKILARGKEVLKHKRIQHF